MQRRSLGRTGWQVSEVAFGAWGIGGMMWAEADDATSLRALHRAIDLGMNLIDTALVYGMGRSEMLVGQVARERARDEIYVATKVPPRNKLWPARADIGIQEVFPPDYVTSTTETCLKNLGLEHIDLLQLHVWNDAWLDSPAWDATRAVLESLKRSGKVRSLGISVSEHDPDSALRGAAVRLFDVLQVLYNIFDPRAAEHLFPVCHEHQVGVLARVPLDEGGLTGTITPETTFPPGDFRNDYFRGERKREVWRRAQALADLLGKEASSLPELALRFCLSHPVVSSVLPGMRRLETVQANASVGDGRVLSRGLLAKLAHHAWPRNFWLD